MRLNKMKTISIILNQPFDLLLHDLYIKKEMSSQEISDYIFNNSKILITTRSIQRQLKKLNLIRDLSSAFNLAIKKGRKNYDRLKRFKKSSSMRKGIFPKLRYEIMQRDGNKCVLCGKTALEDRLEVDHIIPVVAGGTNEVKNLRILCSECNKGKMLLEERKIIAK